MNFETGNIFFSIKCESSNVTLTRLDQALKDANIIQNSYLCVAADKPEIKEKLKQACRQEQKVQIARKYCLEEHGGKYYCLKDGKCTIGCLMYQPTIKENPLGVFFFWSWV